jgi:asparagine synthase (glutamine-hydrolysing)
MCRIVGMVSKSVTESLLSKMRDTLIHGGPDDAGSYVSETDGIGLAQRRLSIIDLTAGGHQPMFFKNFVIVYNGEIYNYKEVRDALRDQGYEFTTESDTEVILKAFDHWGYDCVHQFRGMFAFAIWNTATKKLLLCRDRVGVKPMYWYQKDGLFMFASELKAFHEHPDFDKTINQQAVSLFLQTGYIKSPYCIFKNASKLQPGSFLELDAEGNTKIWKYWSVREKYLSASQSEKSENELIQECETLLRDSFQLRMVADVPVGMFLSGGIDSSLVTALLQDQSLRPLNTFTIGFDDPRYNEAQHAKKVAKHLGTHHTELYCNEKHFEEIIPLMPEIYDEPFGDSSGIPTFLVSKLAREHVTVSLSADAGDEIFTGYNRYLFAENFHSKLNLVPSFAKNILSNIIKRMDVNTASSLISLLPLPENYKKNIDARLPKAVALLSAKSKLDFLYSSTLFINTDNLHKLHTGDNNVFIFDKDLPLKDGLNYAAYGVADIESYLEGDILAKVDRATMRVALEGREPFLDHEIIEFAMSLPDNLKLRNGETKWILRQILYKYVPKELIERPKMGFGIPLDAWLQTMLKNDLQKVCEDKDFINVFSFNQVEVRRLITQYLDKKGFSTHLIWYLYSLHQWYKTWYVK